MFLRALETIRQPFSADDESLKGFDICIMSDPKPLISVMDLIVDRG